MIIYIKGLVNEILVVATTYHKEQMISLTSKPQKKYDVGIHKRTRQGALAALLLYLYNLQVVRATTISN